MTFESPTNLDPPMPGPIEIKEELIEIKEEVADEFDENTDLFSCPTCQALFKDENKFKIHFERHSAADVYKNQNFTIMETPLEIKDENMDFEIELEKYQVQEKLQEPAVDIVQEIKTIDNDYRKRKLPTSETSALTIKKVKLNPLPKSLNLAQKLLMQQKKPWDAKKTKETLPGKTPEIDIAPNKYPNNYLIQPQKLLKGKVVKLALNGAVKNMNNTVKIFRIARREVPKVVVPAHKILLESPDSEERLSSNIHTRPLEIEFLPDPSERVQIQLPPKIIFPTIETVPEPTNFIEIPAISPEQSSSMKPPILNS